MGAASVQAVPTPPTPWIVGPYDSVWSGIVRNQSGKWDEAAPGSAIIVVGSASPEVRNLCAASPDMLAALRPLAAIADAYDANELDDEARKFWGVESRHESDTPPDRIELYQGRGGKRLLTLADCFAARAAIAKAEGRS